MSSIDDRIVAMKFVGSQFESGISSALNSIEKLKQGLDLKGAAKNIDELDNAGKKFSLSHMGESIDGLAAKFTAFNVVAVTALTNITNKAVDAGLRIAKSLALGSITDGYADYERKLTSVQTIMNATGADIKTVGGYFTQLDTYADKTIYNLSDMTGAFAKFTNAGVDMDKSVPAIKGIANMVALAGQDAGAAQIAMYNLSQSIAGGFLTTTDYKSLNLANVATAEWKQNMVDAAVSAGKLKDAGGGAYSLVGGKAGEAFTPAQLFNEQLAEGWASADVLLGVLGEYGDETTAIGKKAQGAAQDVKSFGMMMETLKAAAGTGWTDTFELVVGNVEEAKLIFTPLTNAIGNVIGASADARNNLLRDWKELGGRDVLIDGVTKAFQALSAIAKPIKEAFQEMFPPMTATRLFDLTKGFTDLMAKMMPSAETLDRIKRTFAGVFAVIDTVRLILFELGIVFKLVFDKINGGNGGILNFTANLGDWLVKIHDAIEQSDKFAEFFVKLAGWIAAPINLLKQLAHWVGEFFSSLGDSAGADALESVNGRFDKMLSIGDAVERMWANIWDWMQKVWAAFEPLRSAIGDFFDQLGGKLGESLKNMDYNGILDMINTGLFAGLVLIIKKFMGNGINVDVGGGFLGQIKESLGGLTGVMKAMQTELKAQALMKIAIAIGILTLSVVALSLIDSEGLTKAIAAIAFMMGELVGAMALMDKINSTAGAAKLTLLGLGLIALSVGILILSAAVKVFSTMSWEELAKGFAGLTAALGLIVGVAKLLDGSSGAMIRAGIALGFVAGAVLILATAVKLFASMSWAEMAQGLVGVSAALVALAIFTKLAEANKGSLSSSVGLLIVSGAILVLAQAVKQFGEMDMGVLTQGMAAMSAALIIIAFVMQQMTGALPGAAALLIVAAALWVIAPILEKFGNMEWEQIAKAAVMLAGALAIIAIAAAAMSAPIILVGAAAILIISGALALLGPVLVAFGNMSWESIGKGLAMLAGALLILGVAGALLTPTIPTLIGLGIAIALIGVGIMAAGLGLLAFSVGLTALSVAGAAGALAITAILAAVIGAIPQVFAAIANGIIELAGILTNAAPVFLNAAVVFLLTLLQAISIVIPQAVATIVVLVMALVNAIVALVPFLVDAGYRLITGVINGIAKNLPGIIQAATNLISNFITGIGRAAIQLTNTAAETLVTFLNGLASAIRRYAPQIEAAGMNIASAIIDGMTGGLSRGISAVANKAKEVAQGALNAAKKLLGINSPSKEFAKVGAWSGEGLVIGLDSMAKEVAQSGENVGQSAMDGLKSSLSNMDKALGNVDFDSAPVIRPVLDLSDVKKGAKSIDGLLVPTALIPTASYEKAASIAVDSRQQESSSSVATMEAPSTEPTSVTFVQNNTSPKALNPGEIYRQTKNQISTAKGVLPK